MALLNGARVMDLELTFPPAGGWLCSLHLQSGPVPAAGAAALVVGDLTLPGAIVPGRVGLDAPDRPAAVVAGGYGWRTRLPSPGGAFESPGQVRLSTVLAALGKACDELYDAPPEQRLGKRYGWTAGTRGRAVLAELVARRAIPTWRVEPTTGRTVFTLWPTLPAADRFGVVEPRRIASGAWHVALDRSASAWLPGASVGGIAIARTVFSEANGELKATVYES
jgi:hypothetical protein